MSETNESLRILALAETAFQLPERVAAKTIWDDAAYMCRPVSTSSAMATRGSSLINERITPVGIHALNTFTSGLTSTLTPKGTRFLNYTSETKSDQVSRWLTDASSTALSQVMKSNFFSEINKAFSDLGLIGTAALITEFDANQRTLQFKTIFIDRFAFTEGVDGTVKTTYIQYSYTADQFKERFPEEELKAGQDTYEVVQMLTPRDPATLRPDSIAMEDRPFRSVHVLKGDGSRIILDEGYNQEIISIVRWSQSSAELLGRSPATEALDSLNMVNAMEASKSISAQRLANPQWLVSDKSGIRGLNNSIGGVVYWNGSNAQDEPKQLQLRDQPQITDNFITQKKQDIEDLFFMGVWNPLSGIGKQATATEVDHRVALARQNLVPRINVVIEQLLQPTFNTVLSLLIENGLIPKPPTEDNVEVSAEFSSQAASIIAQIEALAVTKALTEIEFLAKFDPEVIDLVNTDATGRLLIKAGNVPTEFSNSEAEVKDIRAARAKQQAEDAKRQEAAIAAQQAVEAYKATSKAAEEGSPAEQMLEVQQ